MAGLNAICSANPYIEIQIGDPENNTSEKVKK
jgi:hypothetical protein